MVELEEPAETLMAFDLSVVCGRGSVDQLVAEPLVVAFFVIMIEEGGTGSAKRSLSEQDQFVETLGFDRQNKSLAVSVQVRTSSWQLDVLHAGVSEDSEKLVSELGVTVVNEVALVAKETVLAVDEVSGDLRHEGGIRVRRDAGDLDAARRQLDDEEHVVCHEPLCRPDFDGEEIGRAEDVPVCAEEVAPLRLLPELRCRDNAMFLQDTFFRGRRRFLSLRTRLIACRGRRATAEGSAGIGIGTTGGKRGRRGRAAGEAEFQLVEGVGK